MATTGRAVDSKPIAMPVMMLVAEPVLQLSAISSTRLPDVYSSVR